MLVFLDESGDTGHKIDKGSSKYFVVGLVVFEDHDEATRCDQRIELLRKELGKPDNYEFHFANNSEKVRLAFINAIAPYSFTCFAVAINKDPALLWGEGFKTKESFYEYACQMVFTNARPYLNSAIVVIDKSGSPVFRSQLNNYLRNKLTDESKDVIKKIKQQESHRNNLLQLADYSTGIIARKVQDKKDWKKYYSAISSKIIWVQEWPKK